MKSTGHCARIGANGRVCPFATFIISTMPRRLIFVALMLSMLMQAITLGSPLGR